MPALFRRRQIWLPTWQGALLLVVVVARRPCSRFATSPATSRRHEPVAARDGRGASTLIVEGWLEEDGLDAAIAVIASAGATSASSPPAARSRRWREGRSWPTYAERAADYLRRHGVTSIPVVAVAAPESAQDRTFLSAVVVRDWLRRHGGTSSTRSTCSRAASTRAARGSSSGWPSGRRSTSASSPPRRDAIALERWWTTSEGAKAVLDEALSLAWTACCFAPPKPGSHEERSPVPRSPA